MRKKKLKKKNINTIKKLAKSIYGSLGSGYNEVIYDNAMQVGLRILKIPYESQKAVELKYKGYYVGEGYPDIIVHFGKNFKLVVELKAVGSELGFPEEQQLRNYMELLDIKYGLLINFQQPGRSKKEKSHIVEFKEIYL